jgi:hypothetical protein
MAGAPARIHPGKRKANPMLTKNGKPRLRVQSVTQLKDLIEKSQRGKDRAKYERELARRTKK